MVFMVDDMSNSSQLAEGLAVCDSCGRSVACKLVLKEDGFSYLIGECPFEKKPFEKLYAKGPGFYLPEQMPQSWPRWKLNTTGEQKFVIAKEDIENFKNIPRFLISVTNRCNSKCSICRLKDNDHPIDLDIGLLKNSLIHLRHKEIILSGGEPTVRDDLPEIIKLIKESNNYPVLFTNGLKLADRGYIRELKKAGLDHIHLSFDGFSKDIYEKMRGGGAELELKLTALKNLEKERIVTLIRSTIIKGINDSEIKKIFNLAKENLFIAGLTFRPVSLSIVPAGFNFNKEYLLSVEEIRAMVCSALGVLPGEFLFWDKIKNDFALFWQQYFTFLKPPVSPGGCVYVTRNKEGLVPLLSRSQLKKIGDALSKKSLWKIISAIGFESIGLILNSKTDSLFRLSESDEKLLFQMGLVVIRVDFSPFSRESFVSSSASYLLSTHRIF